MSDGASWYRAGILYCRNAANDEIMFFSICVIRNPPVKLISSFSIVSFDAGRTHTQSLCHESNP